MPKVKFHLSIEKDLLDWLESQAMAETRVMHAAISRGLRTVTVADVVEQAVRDHRREVVAQAERKEQARRFLEEANLHPMPDDPTQCIE